MATTQPTAPATIAAQHVTDICQPGKDETTCRYLMFGPGGWLCAKASNMQPMIDARTLRAKGDNCSGSPEFAVPCSPAEARV